MKQNEGVDSSQMLPAAWGLLLLWDKGSLARARGVLKAYQCQGDTFS